MISCCALMAEAVGLPRGLFAPMPLETQLAFTPMIIYAVLLLSLAAAFFALWWSARDFSIFRNMGIYLALCSVQAIWIYVGGEESRWFCIALTAPVLVVIAGQAMHIPRRGWTLLIWPLSLFVAAAGWIHGYHFLRSLPVDVTDLILVVLVAQCLRSGQRRDRPIAWALAFFMCVRATLSEYLRAITHVPAGVTIGGWQWAFTPIAIVLLGTATLVIYVRTLVDDRREKLRMAGELDAARTLQQVLIPEEIPAVPGFRIQSAYRPFGEVGGDFFQILPLSEGGALIAIGDVSGKGLPAAMQVSLLVGNFRALAVFTQSPAEILAAINHHMMGRSNGGFTTCLILRAASSGTLTIANAGHIAPYLAGDELAIENGLPLGLSADALYEESEFQLAPGQELTLMTDGVVEARNAGGELFGFERTAAISMQPAESIAQRAQAFGQEDDITVLTLSFAGAEVRHA